MRIMLLFGELATPEIACQKTFRNDRKCTIKSKQSPKAHPIGEGFTKSWKLYPKIEKVFKELQQHIKIKSGNLLIAGF